MTTSESDPYWNPIRNIILPDAKMQPDRALAIVLAAVVEGQLGEVITDRLVDDKKVAGRMFKGLGPLATFSAKIDMGYLMGLYRREIFDMFHAVRRIRNLFAHDMNPIDLGAQQVRDIGKPLEFMNRLAQPKEPMSGRELYIAGCEGLLGALGAIGMDKWRFKLPQIGKAPSGSIE